MIGETLWQIWKNRNNVKYGNKPTRNIDELFEDINAGFKEELKCFRFSNKHSKLRDKLSSIIDTIIY